VNGWQRTADFLALRRNTGLLLVALVLAGTGERLWLGFAPKYLETLGATVLVIGLFDALQTLLGAIYAYPGGCITDRWGQRRSLLLFNALSLAGHVLVLGVFLFLAWSALSLPATFSVVASSLDKSQHTMGVGVQSMVRRVPMMVGPLIGGWLITRLGWEQGVRYALLGCIALGTATAAFQWFMSEPTAEKERWRPAREKESRDTRAGGPRSGFLGVVKSFSPMLRELLVSDILIRFCERLPYAFVILWAMDQRQGVRLARLHRNGGGHALLHPGCPSR
jgi:MFS family permease